MSCRPHGVCLALLTECARACVRVRDCVDSTVTSQAARFVLLVQLAIDQKGPDHGAADASQGAAAGAVAGGGRYVPYRECCSLHS